MRIKRYTISLTVLSEDDDTVDDLDVEDLGWALYNGELQGSFLIEDIESIEGEDAVYAAAEEIGVDPTLIFEEDTDDDLEELVD